MRVIIIGNGAAGNQAGDTIRRYSPNTEIIMYSSENNHFYSACALPDYMAGRIDRTRLFIKAGPDYRNARIETHFGSVIERIDTENKHILADNKKTPYDCLIIATGSRAIIPGLKGIELAGNFVVKTVQDADQIIRHKPERAVVIGSGNIGVEAAEALKMKGCQTTIIEMQDRVMPKIFDPKPAGLIRELLEQNGIEVFTGEKAMEVLGQNRVEGILTDKRIIKCDTVIWAAGVKQNTGLAADAGLLIGELGGIKTNAYMQTNNDAVYACGDCIETFDMLTGQPVLSLLWPSAKRQAEIAAMNCLGRQVEYEGAFNVIVEEIYDKNCAAIGLSQDLLGDYKVQVVEQEANGNYFRLLLSHENIVGMQALGEIKDLGPIMAMIRTHTSLSEIERIVNTRSLLEKMPGYIKAGQLLF